MDKKQEARARRYLASRERFNRLIQLSRSCFDGFWLGMMDPATLQAVDTLHYQEALNAYHTDEWNRQGLMPWEQEMVDRYFQSCRSLLVGSVGGGREVLALLQKGYEVDSFECHPYLNECANRLLKKEGYTAQVQLVPRDECPVTGKRYDGLIIGWGAYMLIQTRARRVAFLKKMRAQVDVGSPLLLSFYHRGQQLRSYRLTARVGALVRRLRGQRPVEVGDSLAPNYVHYFMEEEVASELEEGGFELAYYGTRSYGHAVGIAAEAP